MYVYFEPQNLEIQCKRVSSVVPLGRYTSGQSSFLIVFCNSVVHAFRFCNLLVGYKTAFHNKTFFYFLTDEA